MEGKKRIEIALRAALLAKSALMLIDENHMTGHAATLIILDIQTKLMELKQAAMASPAPAGEQKGR